MGDAIGRALVALAWIAVLSAPLALWKLVEIVVWIVSNVRITIG